MYERLRARARDFVLDLSSRARARRGRIFRERLRPCARDTILDLGGGSGSHVAAVSGHVGRITVADIRRDALAEAWARYGFRTVELGEDARLPFAEGEYDIVFCSSVIEHVTGPKQKTIAIDDDATFRASARWHQEQFANEIRRVAKRYFVQTPYRYFPLESHSWLPLPIIFLPRRMQKRALALFGRFWPKKTEPDWHLLTASDMRRLFPDAELVRERIGPFTKSLIAIRR